MSATEFFKYLVEHPSAAKTVGIAVLCVIAAPIIIAWFRGGQMRKAIKTYHGIINDLTGQVGQVYESISALQKELSRTQGELATARVSLNQLEAEVQLAHEVSEKQQKEITRLQALVKTLEKRERELEAQLASQ